MSYSRHNANVRNDRMAGLIVGLCAAGLSLAIYFGASSCISNPDGTRSPDWIFIEQELGFAALDAKGVAELAGSDLNGDGEPDHPKTAKLAAELSEHLLKAEAGAKALAAGEPAPSGLIGSVESALAILKQMVRPEDQAFVLLAEGALRRIKAYVKASSPGVSASLGLVRVLAA